MTLFVRRPRPWRNVVIWAIIIYITSYFVTCWLRYCYGDNFMLNIRKTVLTDYLNIPDDISCYRQISAKTYFIQDNSIFLILPSCETTLTMQQACAIESVSRAHRDKLVYLLSPLRISEKMVLLLPSDVLFIPIQIDKFVVNTPFEGIFCNEFLDIGMKKHDRVLEILKFAVLYKYGGIVIDLNMIIAKTTEFLGVNWVAKINETSLGSDIMALSRDTVLGRTLIKTVIKNLIDQKGLKKIDGGSALTEAFKSMCFDKQSDECSDFKIYRQKHFYPFNQSSNIYFTNESLQATSYGYYVWDARRVRRQPGTIYYDLMREYCPYTWKYF